MKGIIRIAGLEYRGFSYVYWNLYVVQEVVRKIKKEIGGTAITHFKPFFRIGKDRYRVDYLLISCTSSSWDRLKKELEWRYVCVDKSFRFNKRKQSWVRTEVNFWTTKELENELTDFPALIDSRRLVGEKEDARFEIRLNPTEFNREGDCPFYKPYTEFDIKEGDNYKKNLEAGTLILESERKWKRDGGEKKWRKRKAWKTVGGNYKEVK